MPRDAARFRRGIVVLLLGSAWAAGLLLASLPDDAAAAAHVRVGGTLQQWHAVVLDFIGPNRREAPATFRNFRLDVTFTHPATGRRMAVPGFFAADGDAAETGATSGSVWRVNFAPPLTGIWTYRASFRSGTNVAASTSHTAGDALAPIDGTTGSLTIGPSTASGPDVRAAGLLRRRTGNYLSFADGSTFIEGGADSPEDLLAFADFDGTVPTHSYAPHLGDWVPGDPSWRDGRGKGLIGAVNYLASLGVNSMYLLTLNVRGDADDVWPWTSRKATTTYDVSKLAQWEIVFTHMQRRGVAIHLVLQDDDPLDMFDDGRGSVARSIYYREILARFAHHNALFLNPKEEISFTAAQTLAHARRLRKLDPYDHPIVIHNDFNKGSRTFTPLLGQAPIDGVALQEVDPLPAVRRWTAASKAAGRPWVVLWDEQAPETAGAYPDDDVGAAANNDRLRRKWWQVVLNGSGGTEWILRPGDGGEEGIEDFRRWNTVWRWTGAAVSIVGRTIPVARMRNADALTPSTIDSVMAEAGRTYAIYLPEGGSSTLDLTGHPVTFALSWFDPLTGAGPLSGTVQTVLGGGPVDLGTPPGDPAVKDWVVVVSCL